VTYGADVNFRFFMPLRVLCDCAALRLWLTLGRIVGTRMRRKLESTGPSWVQCLSFEIAILYTVSVASRLLQSRLRAGHGWWVRVRGLGAGSQVQRRTQLLSGQRVNLTRLRCPVAIFQGACAFRHSIQFGFAL
jgi:hypothetical protein